MEADTSSFDRAVYDAAGHAQIERLQAALASKPHLLDAPDPSQGHRTPMHQAALTGRVNSIELLIRSGSHAIDQPDSEGITPMCLATLKGNAQVIETLVRSGSRAIDTPDRFGYSPMYAAVVTGHVAVIETLVRLGSTAIDNTDNGDGTPMLAAARFALMPVISTLVGLGASRNVPTYGLSETVIKMLAAPVDEEEAAQTRYRVYFAHSLTDRLLFNLDMHIRLATRLARPS